MPHIRWLLSVAALASPGCASLPGEKAVPVTLEQLAESPEQFAGRRIRVDACMVNYMHGIFLHDCGPARGKRLKIVVSPPAQGEPAHARYSSLFPDVVGHYGYRTRLTGTFRIGNPPPDDHWGSKYSVLFEADSGTSRYEP